MRLWYYKDNDMSLTAYSDPDHAGCQDTSTSGSAQFLGDKLVSWSSEKQKSTAISSTEAEYIALSCVIALCCNNVQHSKAKHIDVRYHFIKEQVENGIVELYFVRTEYQLADIFTKPLQRERFNFLIEKLGMRSMSPEMLKRLTEEEDEIVNPQETQQVATRDEKWVSSTERVKISSTNIRLETTMSQKSLCSNSSTPSRRIILDICPRVEGVDFTDFPDDDTALTFLIDLGYKGPLNRHTNMFVDHMHQPWRTLAAIINKCLSGKTASKDKLRKSRIDILLKFVRIGEDYQEYGLPIPDVMLTDAIKHSESYQMFIKYLTHQIPPKKRGKCSKGRKTVGDSQETVDVSKESEPEPELVKKKTASRRVVKKIVTLSADDNIISNDPDATLELAKSISQTEAKEAEAEAARKVHDTHARIVTESVPESAKKKSGGRSSKRVVIQDTPSTLKSKPATSKTKLKGAPSLTPQEQETTDIMQALKESKKTSKRQPGTRVLGQEAFNEET
ncbi:hypothetical protein Tco_1013028 [Tanacetum coccineum]